MAVELGLIVGAGLLANAVYQPAHASLTHRIREQARSHIWIALHQTKVCCSAFAFTTQVGYQAAVLCF